MKRVTNAGALVLVIGALLLAGCGSGKYVHTAGDCYVQNGRVQITIEAYRDKGVSDNEAAPALTAACRAADRKLHP